MRDLDWLQLQIGLWGDRTFGGAQGGRRQEAVLAHLQDEVHELVESGDPAEAADCLILLLGFAHLEGVSLYDATRRKHEVNRQRQWGEPDERGVVHHVDETPEPRATPGEWRVIVEAVVRWRANNLAFADALKRYDGEDRFDILNGLNVRDAQLRETLWKLVDRYRRQYPDPPADAGEQRTMF